MHSAAQKTSKQWEVEAMNRYERDWRDDDRHSRGRRDEGILERIKNDVKAWFDDDDDDDARDRHRGGYGSSQGYGSSRGSRTQDRDRDADRFRNLGSRSRYGRHSGDASYGESGEDYNYPRSSYGGGRGYEDDDRGYGQGRNYRSGDYGSSAASGEDYGRGGDYGQSRGNRSGADYGGGYDRGNEGRGRYGSDEYGASSRSQGRGGSGTPVWLYSEYYWVTPGPHSGVGPRNFERSADTLKERVCERLQGNGGIDAAEIDVEVDSEEVTLTGTVKDRRQKRLAEECAESVYGVRDVHNRLSVKRDEDQDQSRSSSSGYGSAKRSVN
jgi:hypothetical protein